MQGVLIVPVTEDIIPQIAEIEKESFSTPRSEASLLDDFGNLSSAMIAAVSVESGKVLGWAGFTHIFGEASVTDIAVKTESRRQGIGTELTCGLLKKAEELNLETIILEVRESNLTAKNIYTKLGFLEIAVRKNFYNFPRENGITMKKQII